MFIMRKCHSTALVIYKMQHPKSLTLYWHSVYNLLTLGWHLFLGVATLTVAILPIAAADNLIMDQCRSTALGLFKMQHPKSLMLCWRSVDALLMLCWRSVDALLMLCWRSNLGVATSTSTILPIKAVNTSIINNSLCTTLGLYNMQFPKSLMLCWHTFSKWCCFHVTISFAFKGYQYSDYG